MADVDQQQPQSLRLEVVYCKVCGFPPEYCEFGLSLDKCKQWLAQNDEKLFEKLYGADLEGSLKSLSVDENNAKETDDGKKLEKLAAKEAAKKDREEKKKMSSKVIIKRSERSKRKVVTSIFGLEVFDVELKKAAKIFANKFACGASVTKNNQGLDEICIQGDFSDEVFDLILETWKAVPEDNIDCIEDKPAKKKGPKLPPPQQRPA